MNALDSSELRHHPPSPSMRHSQILHTLHHVFSTPSNLPDALLKIGQTSSYTYIKFIGIFNFNDAMLGFVMSIT